MATGFACFFFAADYIHIDSAAVVDELVHHRTKNELLPARAQGLPMIIRVTLCLRAYSIAVLATLSPNMVAVVAPSFSASWRVRDTCSFASFERR